MNKKTLISICLSICLLTNFSAFSRIGDESLDFIDSLLTNERNQTQVSEKEARLALAKSYEKNGEFGKANACYQAIAHLDSLTLANLREQSTKNTTTIYQLAEAKQRNETLKNEQFRLYACIPIGFLIVLAFYQR
jgi:hypothetical protein